MISTFPMLQGSIVTISEEQALRLREYSRRNAFDPFSSDSYFERFVTRSFLLSKILSDEVIEALLQLRRHDNDDGVVVIRGLSIDDDRIGPTPSHWSAQAQNKKYFETEMYLVGLASILGEVFSFSSQHDGNIVQNIVPLQSDAYEQVGTGSQVFLEWHTEDAFHRLRADFIGLLCLRSDPSAATTFSSIKRINIPDNIKRHLFEKKYLAGIDKAHGGSGRPEDGILIDVLSGRFDDPFIRLDTSCIRAKEDELEAQEALTYLISQIPYSAHQIVLQKGDLLFLDNYRVVHGRTAFRPKFDGADRWLQRVSITSDLRKLRLARMERQRVIKMSSEFMG